MFYKLNKEKSPAYLFQLNPENSTPILQDVFKKVKSFFFFFFSRQNQSFFKSSFFPVVIIEWNKIDVHIRNSGSCNVFYRIILKFIRPELNQVFNVDSSEGLKFLARTRLARLRKSYL